MSDNSNNPKSPVSGDTFSENVGIRCVLEAVSPEKAAEYLKKNLSKNRKLYHQTVEKYCDDMKSGNWVIAESIKFNVNGDLIDGQHRLHAIIRSGVTVNMIVCRGLAEEAVKGIDLNRSRQTNDLAVLLGYGRVPSQFFAAINCLNNDLTKESNNSFNYCMGRTLTKSEQLFLYLHYKPFFDWYLPFMEEKYPGARGGKERKISIKAPVLATLLKAWHQANHDRLAEFIYAIDAPQVPKEISDADGAMFFAGWVTTEKKNGGAKTQINTMRVCQAALKAFLGRESRKNSFTPKSGRGELFPIEPIKAMLADQKVTSIIQMDFVEHQTLKRDEQIEFDTVKDCLNHYAANGQDVYEKLIANGMIAVRKNCPERFDFTDICTAVESLKGSPEMHSLFDAITDDARVGSVMRPIFKAFCGIIAQRLLLKGYIEPLYAGSYLMAKPLKKAA